MMLVSGLGSPTSCSGQMPMPLTKYTKVNKRREFPLAGQQLLFDNTDKTKEISTNNITEEHIQFKPKYTTYYETYTIRA